MVRAGFSGNGHATSARFAEQSDAPGGTEMLAVDGCAGLFSQENVAGDDDLLAGGRPSAQPP